MQQYRQQEDGEIPTNGAKTLNEIFSGINIPRYVAIFINVIHIPCRVFVLQVRIICHKWVSNTLTWLDWRESVVRTEVVHCKLTFGSLLRLPLLLLLLLLLFFFFPLAFQTHCTTVECTFLRYDNWIKIVYKYVWWRRLWRTKKKL